MLYRVPQSDEENAQTWWPGEVIAALVCFVIIGSLYYSTYLVMLHTGLVK